MWLSLRSMAVAACGGSAGGSAGWGGGTGADGGGSEESSPPPPQPANATPNKEATQAARAYFSDRLAGLQILLIWDSLIELL
jgi:hypothetical protein